MRKIQVLYIALAATIFAGLFILPGVGVEGFIGGLIGAGFGVSLGLFFKKQSFMIGFAMFFSIISA